MDAEDSEDQLLFGWRPEERLFLGIFGILGILGFFPLTLH